MTDLQIADAPFTSDFIEVDKALESMRDSGFDLTAAVGEPVDNSIEAHATIVRIEPRYSANKSHITDLAFADNGRGIEGDGLARVLKMGYSTRYGQRAGLGRFGVGLKLAALSVGRRIEVYTKPVGQEKYFHAYMDLDDIGTGEQTQIESEEVDAWPSEYADLMQNANGEPFESGTLVLWRKIDRLSSGGTYGESLDKKLADLRKFISRAYRRFIDQGLQVYLLGKPVTLHDPTFLLDDPRIIKQYAKREDISADQTRGVVIEETDLKIDGHDVHVVVTVVPEIFRHRSGTGGDTDLDNRDIREFQINQDNEGRISILRNGREIYYDIVPRMLPAGVSRGDRYIGVEVSFPAELDEYFQVRHVKRGTEPVDKLRNALRTWLQRPIRAARKEIRKHWSDVEVAEHAVELSRRSAAVQQAVDQAEQTSPRGQAGLNLTPAQESEVVEKIIEDLDIADADADGAEVKERVRTQIASQAITLLDGNWPGKELIELDHLNGKVVLRMNQRHPFFAHIYGPLRDAVAKPADELDASELHSLLRRAVDGLDVLFFAYAKAENMQRDPEQFDDLRTYWGQHAHAYIKGLMRIEDI
ncbi:ATP-binding protein [Microbacterium sp. NPDC090225]|uniref:ATP-binding protein n=1 Tax=Microbacterium sp. NPDC090225 TaxID=3364207 RepID=UPI00381A944A